jgi:hypothetical protein
MQTQETSFSYVKAIEQAYSYGEIYIEWVNID